MPEIIKIYRDHLIGWETVAECEICVERFGELRGCYDCDNKGWRYLTEDEEMAEWGLKQLDPKTSGCEFL